MKERFRRAWLRLNPDPSRTSVVVAVSGGLDSMVCLDLLDKLRQEYLFSLTVAHVNHHLRPDSDKDQALVEEEARHRKLLFQVRSPDFTGESGDGPEAQARELRYAALESIRQEVGADLIVTAHHGNDQIETILFRLQSGAGAPGLAGIPERRGRILRPLLSFSRQDLEQYAQANQINYCEDSTNRDESIPRNFLRHRIVTPWQAKVPSLTKQIQHSVKALQSMEASLKYLIEQYLLPSVGKKLGAHWVFNGHLFDMLDEDLKIRTIQILDSPAEPWRRKDWNSLRQTLSSRKTGLLHPLPGGSYLLRNRNQWILRVKPLPKRVTVPVLPGERVELPSGIFVWNPVSGKTIEEPRPGCEIVDEDCLKAFGELVLRHWQDGDYIQPLGMHGRKKVSDLLIDLKVDRFSKANQYVLAQGKEVLWVCGHRISEQIKLTPRTRNQAELLFENLVTGL
ncbi:MAG: tRNA lysidine(34) synthetase TilS [FCB group bacterium]|nr:tRNA lysidine(34) synthetase TilS [FCB group bacterium]